MVTTRRAAAWCCEPTCSRLDVALAVASTIGLVLGVLVIAKGLGGIR